MSITHIVLTVCLLLAGTAFTAILAPIQPIALPIIQSVDGSISTTPIVHTPMVVDNQSLVTNSDAIVSGTVTNVQDILTQNKGYWMYPGGRGPNMVHVLQVTIHVEQALFGVDDSQTLRFSFPLSPYNDPAMNIDLKVGDKKLFFLREEKDGYSLAMNAQGIAALDKVDDVVKLLKTRPLTISASLVSNLYFEQFMPMTVKVKNNTDAAYTVSSIFISGYYLSKRMENMVACSLSTDGKQINGRAMATPLSVPAHEEREIAFFIYVNTPQSMSLLGADSYLLAPMALRAVISCANGEGNTQQTMIRSATMNVYAGYPLPQHAEQGSTSNVKPVSAIPDIKETPILITPHGDALL